ncbi:6-phosphofructokinase, partial [bacterium]|nr:6-phosphofructokinase [bacterium]
MSSSTKNADPGLIRMWEETEKNRSLFEREVRNLPLPVKKAFTENGKISPAGFKPSEEKLAENRNLSRVAEAFPKLYPLTGDRVLKADTANRPRVSGKRVAVLFSGGPAAGGHNVLAGLKKVLGPDNILLGVKGGPKGLLEGKLLEIKEEDLAWLLNTGGFDFLGTDRTKIKNHEQFKLVKAVCRDQRVDALVIIGG